MLDGIQDGWELGFEVRQLRKAVFGDAEPGPEAVVQELTEEEFAAHSQARKPHKKNKKGARRKTRLRQRRLLVRRGLPPCSFYMLFLCGFSSHLSLSLAVHCQHNEMQRENTQLRKLRAAAWYPSLWALGGDAWLCDVEQRLWRVHQSILLLRVPLLATVLSSGSMSADGASHPVVRLAACTLPQQLLIPATLHPTCGNRSTCTRPCPEMSWSSCCLGCTLARCN